MNNNNNNDEDNNNNFNYDKFEINFWILILIKNIKFLKIFKNINRFAFLTNC